MRLKLESKALPVVLQSRCNYSCELFYIHHHLLQMKINNTVSNKSMAWKKKARRASCPRNCRLFHQINVFFVAFPRPLKSIFESDFCRHLGACKYALSQRLVGDEMIVFLFFFWWHWADKEKSSLCYFPSGIGSAGRDFVWADTFKFKGSWNESSSDGRSVESPQSAVKRNNPQRKEKSGRVRGEMQSGWGMVPSLSIVSTASLTSRMTVTMEAFGGRKRDMFWKTVIHGDDLGHPLKIPSVGVPAPGTEDYLWQP